MPFALAASRQDADPTDVLETDRHAAQPDEVRTVARDVGADTPPTRALTSVHQAARAPYMQPAPPRPREDVPVLGDWRPPPSGTPKLQRGLLLGGLFALVAVGFAAAPYLALAALFVAALVVRTWSWTAEAARDRTLRRGRRRWYDGPLAAASSPWYLLVATGGTLVLVLWSAALAFFVGMWLLVFRAPLEAGLLVMGAVLTFAAWWGPGARRLRTPTRSLVLAATRSPAVGWLAVTAVCAVAAASAYVLATQGVAWDPQPGPPWRRDTLLGEVIAFF